MGDELDPTKKKYAAIMIWDEGVVMNEIKYVGIEAIRSDWGMKARELQKKVIGMIFDEKKIEDIVMMLKEKKDFVAGKNLVKSDLILYKALGKPVTEYGDENGKGKPPHARVAEVMFERGMEVWGGLSIPYIVVGREDNKIKVIYAEDYNGIYDEEYYWNKQIYAPSYRVLKSVYPRYNWDLLKLNCKIGKFKQRRDQKGLFDFT